jgi:hypothetical protein
MMRGIERRRYANALPVDPDQVRSGEILYSNVKHVRKETHVH